MWPEVFNFQQINNTPIYFLYVFFHQSTMQIRRNYNLFVIFYHIFVVNFSFSFLDLHFCVVGFFFFTVFCDIFIIHSWVIIRIYSGTTSGSFSSASSVITRPPDPRISTDTSCLFTGWRRWRPSPASTRNWNLEKKSFVYAFFCHFFAWSLLI